MTARAMPSRRRSISSAPARSPRATPPTPGTSTCSSATRRPRPRPARRRRPPAQLSFDSAGALTSPTGSVAFGSVFPSGASAPIAITLDFGTATRQAAGAFSIGRDRPGRHRLGEALRRLDRRGRAGHRQLHRRHHPGARQAADRQFLQSRGPSPARRRPLDGRPATAAPRSSARPAPTPSAGSSPARSSGPMSTSPRSWSR